MLVDEKFKTTIPPKINTVTNIKLIPKTFDPHEITVVTDDPDFIKCRIMVG